MVSLDEFEKHEDRDDRRHEENIDRFRSLEISVASVTAQMKVVIALLVANGVINVLSGTGTLHH